MTLAPGTKLGPYEIVAPLGAGGMGEVFRARDPRLSRDVAIKALPAAFAQDAERLARFEREAKLLASLNHPNVAGIHGVEEAGGTRYLVLEFVDGETLEAHLNRGALPLAEVLDIAKQVAAGVEAAHESGVVHRDLKPGNVMLTASGGVKVLDFGLAKSGTVRSASSSDPRLSASPTMTYHGTEAGMILGTAAYMSPEQARGKAVDRRTDVWSFGCVLYEMLAGRRAYDGETVSDMVARILEREPDWSALPAATPPRLVALLKRCLTKDAKQRQRDIGDVRLDLEAIAAGDTGAEAVRGAAAPLPKANALPWALAAFALVAAIATLAFAFGPWRGSVDEPALVRFTLDTPAGTTLAAPAEAELSPDGQSVVFVVQDSTGSQALALRMFASPEARILAGTAHAALPFWAPDGRRIGFFADGKLRKLALEGGAVVDLCDAPDARGGAWAPGGKIVFAPRPFAGLQRVSENGGQPVDLTHPDSTKQEKGHRYPQFLPDGRHLLFVAITNEPKGPTYVTDLDGAKPVEIMRAGSMARWSGAHELLFLDAFAGVTRRRLLAREYDPATGKVSGDPRLVIDGVNTTNFGYANATSKGGEALVVQHWDDPHFTMYLRETDGRIAATPIADCTSPFAALSPDGRRVAFAGSSPQDVLVRDFDSGVTARLTFDDRSVNSVVWTPDGRRLVFGRLTPDRGWELHAKNADGSGTDSVLAGSPGFFNLPQQVSHDGRWLLAQCADPSGDLDIWKVPLVGGGIGTVYQHLPGTQSNAAFSADDRWISFVSVEGGRTSLYVQSFPEPGARYQINLDRLAGGSWDPSGQHLVVADEANTLWRIDATLDGGFRQGRATRMFTLPRGEFALDFDRSTGRALTSALRDADRLSRLEVVLGWRRILERP